MRKNFYSENTANFPRLKTDVFFADYENLYKYGGFVDEAFDFVSERQLLRAELWSRFVQQFREHGDRKGGWRGEYWGKMMRGACFVYSYTRSPELYRLLSETVDEIMTTAEESGRISSFSSEREFTSWDIWSRKYVLLGMQYFLEICEDEEQKKKILASMRAQLDYIMSKVGKEEGKISAPATSGIWRGMNSLSILEPVVRLYSLTGEGKYLDYANYIASFGGTDVENIFILAKQDDLYPYQYPVTKAYEMTSCFEGLIELYRITGVEWYRTAIINFANRVLESDFTVIGSAGCTHELFDHSTVRQANTTNGEIQQETCVTVTLMKFFYQLTLLTGDFRYADAFERSFYNAYLGAFNTEGIIEPMMKQKHPECELEALPFDSYSPLTSGTRGNGVGGFMIMSDNHYYGCCACIGSAGIGLVPKMQLMSKEDGFVINLYINGEVKTKTPSGQVAVFRFETDYPKTGRVNIEIETEKPETFNILLRNPEWSKRTELSLDGEKIEAKDGYTEISAEWSGKNKICIDLDMRTELIYPQSYGSQILMTKTAWGFNLQLPLFDREDALAKRHIALRRGPVMLAQDSRLGYSTDDAISVKSEDGYIETELSDEPVGFPTVLNVNIPLSDGRYMKLVDYSSAGKLWTEESKTAVWLLTE